MTDLKPCPFCGEVPELLSEGTWIEIYCCISMSRQKSDYMTMEERHTYNPETHRCDEEIERRVLDNAIKAWNTRHIREKINGTED